MKKYILTIISIVFFMYFDIQAGMFDQVEVEAITSASTCNDCRVCSLDDGISGKCGEKYILNKLQKNDCEAYEAQHNSSGHGVDILAFDNENQIILLHESKFSQSSPTVTVRKFESSLGTTRSHGQQCSLTWYNDAFNKMLKSSASNIRSAASDAIECLEEGNYSFLRTGNLRADANGISKIQLYKIVDAQDSDRIAVEYNTIVKKGPFVKFLNKIRGVEWFEKSGFESQMLNNDIIANYFN